MAQYKDMRTNTETDYADEIAFCEQNINHKIRKQLTDPFGSLIPDQYLEGVLEAYRIDNDPYEGKMYHKFMIKIDTKDYYIAIKDLDKWEHVKG